MAQIEFSEEQNMLLDTAGEFCKSNASMDLVRSSIATETGIEAEIWKEIAGLGWLGIIVPEEFGGLGLALSDVVPIVESMGRHLMSAPYCSTIMATQAIAKSCTKHFTP